MTDFEREQRRLIEEDAQAFGTSYSFECYYCGKISRLDRDTVLDGALDYFVAANLCKNPECEVNAGEPAGRLAPTN